MDVVEIASCMFQLQ